MGIEKPSDEEDEEEKDDDDGEAMSDTVWEKGLTLVAAAGLNGDGLSRVLAVGYVNLPVSLMAVEAHSGLSELSDGPAGNLAQQDRAHTPPLEG
ncbi:unnamed protein product, partial [Haemonchus placei]|uniref:Uncharacterized protein n=1 Tax=Haemonchus placei TaxID=6290 RepID=A0A0N4XAF7_HAEPC